ncbi:MAG: hypothetical protein JSS02_18565 [Planctomycetes bacterium]|nr:hypothetical protein [Planctomycetota bacterium]
MIENQLAKTVTDTAYKIHTQIGPGPLVSADHRILPRFYRQCKVQEHQKVKVDQPASTPHRFRHEVAQPECIGVDHEPGNTALVDDTVAKRRLFFPFE